MKELNLEIKQLIINSLGLEDITPSDIEDDTPLFGEDGLGLDSVDALELGLAIQKHFGFQLDSGNDEMKKSFENVSTLAKFIIKQRNAS